MKRRFITFLGLCSLISSHADAANGTWNGNTSSEFITNTNWTPGLPGATDTGFFNSTFVNAPIATFDASIGSLDFLGGSPTLTTNNFVNFNINSTGVIASTGVQLINVQGGSKIYFNNASSADAANSGNPLYTLSNGKLFFNDSSVTGRAVINANSGSTITFNTSSGIGATNAAALTLNASNLNVQKTVSLGSLTADATSVINLSNNSTLAFGQSNTSTTIAAPITGSGAILKEGSGTVTLTGINTYTDGTTVSGGTLKGTTDSLTGDFLVNAALTIDQSFIGAFNGHLMGTGDFNVTGGGIVIFDRGSSMFAGTTHISDARLALFNYLGGNVEIDSGGILSGLGVIFGNVSVNNGGTISPTGNFGTLTVQGGDFVQHSGSTYETEVNQYGGSTLVEVFGHAILEPGANLKVVSSDGVVNPNLSYQILYASDGLTGTYTNVMTWSPLITGLLTYTDQSVFLMLQRALSNIAETNNQYAVAQQLESITDPTLEELAVLNALKDLPPEEARHALDEMSGEQYTSLVTSAELAGHQFIRRLYDPVRYLITTNPCLCPTLDACINNLGVWFDIGASKTAIDGTQSAKGYKLHEYEFSFGAQTRLTRTWTFGLAGFYEKGTLDFDLKGSGTSHTFLYGAYALYRPHGYYLLFDFILGNSDSNIKRSINVGQDIHYRAHGSPKVRQGNFYFEAGKDLPVCSFLIQPFVGLELGYYHLKTFREHGASFLDLRVKSQTDQSALTSLGFHITTVENMCNILLSLDLAWVCRLTSTKNNIHEEFTTFGECFVIDGFHLPRNSFEGNLTLSKTFCDMWEVYADLYVRKWSNANNYGGVVGAKISF